MATAALPGLFVALVLGRFLELTGAAQSDWFAGLSALSIADLSALGLLIGAAFGAYLAGRRRDEQLGTPPVATHCSVMRSPETRNDRENEMTASSAI